MRSDSIHEDLSLLDMAAGHFAHMELATSYEMSFPIGREVANLARQSVMSSRDSRAFDDTRFTEPVNHDICSLDLSSIEAVSCADLFQNFFAS